MNVLVIEYWYLIFICILVLEIWNFIILYYTLCAIDFAIDFQVTLPPVLHSCLTPTIVFNILPEYLKKRYLPLFINHQRKEENDGSDHMAYFQLAGRRSAGCY